MEKYYNKNRLGSLIKRMWYDKAIEFVDKGVRSRMSHAAAPLIERIELPERFYFHYRVEQPAYYYFHAHQGMELVFVHHGSGQAIIGDQLVQVGSGSWLLLQPYQLHKIQMNAEYGYIRSVMVFDPAVLDPRLEAFPALRHFFRLLWKNELPIQHVALKGQLADEMAWVLENGNTALSAATGSERRLEEMALLAMSLLQLLRRAFAQERDGEELPVTNGSARPVRTAEMAMQWIESHYQEEFRLDRLADELFLSPSHLSRVFRQETGSTLTDYLTARRLREACLLLAVSTLPVGEIAPRIGLVNVPYFVRLFRRHFGVTPLQYRKGKQARLTEEEKEEKEEKEVKPEEL